MTKIFLFLAVIVTANTVFSMGHNVAKPWSSSFEQLVRQNVKDHDYQDLKQAWNNDFEGVSVNRYVPLLRCAIAQLYAKRRAILYGDYQTDLRNFVRKMVNKGLPVTTQEAAFLQSKEPGLWHSNVLVFEPKNVMYTLEPQSESAPIISPMGHKRKSSFSCTDTRYCTPTPHQSVLQWRPIHNSPEMLHTSGSSSSLPTPNMLSPDNSTELLSNHEHSGLIKPKPVHK